MGPNYPTKSWTVIGSKEIHLFLHGSEGVNSGAPSSMLSISTSQEYQQTRRHLQKKILSKNANRFGGNCFSNDKRFETGRSSGFSLPLYSFPTGHFFAIMEQKHNHSYSCLSLWRVKNQVQVIQKGSGILWWICKGQICWCALKVKSMPFILPGALSQVY